MKLIIWFLAWLIVMTWACAAFTYGQMYPSQPPLLGELKRDCYGPAISCDGAGRPFHWRPEGTQDGPNVMIEPKVNAYGFGRSSDQFGRIIEPEIEQTEPSRGSNRRLQWEPGKNHDTE